MSNRQDYFDNLLDDFKERSEHQDLLREINEESKICEASQEYQDYIYEDSKKDWHSNYCARIMESGIFHKGGLKGANLDFNASDFEVHTIDKLEDLLLEVASNLEIFSAVKDIQARECWIRELFESLENNFNQLLYAVKLYKGGRAAQQLERKRKEMLKLQEDILQRPSRTPKPSDIKEAIANIFHKYVKAPKVIIAERVSDLLNSFGIDAKPESVRDKLKNK